MDFDLFCSVAQTARNGVMPSQDLVLSEFIEQAVLADELGMGCVWVAESHFSLAQQRLHTKPVMSHWQGEVGLNTDICLLAAHVFARTSRINVGSAIMNVVSGGPIAAAERVASALAWHGLDRAEHRHFNLGFASGRFDYVSETLGTVPRNDAEANAWPVVKAALLQEAGEIVIRLLSGEAIASDDIGRSWIERTDCEGPRVFDALRATPCAVSDGPDRVSLAPRWRFEKTAIVPDFRPELLQFYAGTHVPALQKYFNTFAPVRVLNLSITQPAVIEATHERMRSAYHCAGGPWRRSYLPRTVHVFLNADPRLTPASQRAAAQAEAETALCAYWSAMEGTVDPARLASSAANAVIGNPDDVADQLCERFDPNDRLMLWFDFFRSSGDVVLDQMLTFANRVAPAVQSRISARGLT